MTTSNSAQSSAHNGTWKVVDPARVAAGYYGTTFHNTKREAERRVAMFPGSVAEFVPGATP